MRDNGVIVTLDAPPNAKVEVTTAQGDFALTLSDLPYGRAKRFLKGKIQVQRVTAPTRLTSDATEDDFPSAVVAPDGTIWVAYVSYKHGIPPAERVRRFKEEPKDFEFLAAPVGGDEIELLRFANGQWSDPMAVTKGGEDLYGVAVAVDGQARTWVFWSANADGNWHLYARSASAKADRWSEQQRLTTDPGADINPVAATDAKGGVWIAWQGFRGDHSDIFAKRLTDGKWL